MADYIIRIRNPKSLNVEAEVPRFSSLWWKRRTLDAGEFQMVVDRLDVDADSIEMYRIVEIRRDGDFEFAGVISRRDYDTDRQQWTLSGFDAKGWWLTSSETRPASGQEFDTQTNVAAETAMKHYVADHLTAPTDADRDVNAELSVPFTVEADAARGNDVEYNARYKNLLDVLIDLGRVGNIYHDVRLAENPKGYEYIALVPTDATVGSGTTPVVFSAQGLENVESARYIEDALRLRNALYVLGGGSGATREVEEVEDAQSLLDDFRREGHIDARDADTAAKLTQAGNVAIAQSLLDRQQATMQPITVGPTTYRDVWDLGYDVTLKFLDIDKQVDRRIEEVHVTLDKQRGETVKVALGRRPQTLMQIIADRLRLNNAVQVA